MTRIGLFKQRLAECCAIVAMIAVVVPFLVGNPDPEKSSERVNFASEFSVKNIHLYDSERAIVRELGNPVKSVPDPDFPGGTTLCYCDESLQAGQASQEPGGANVFLTLDGEGRVTHIAAHSIAFDRFTFGPGATQADLRQALAVIGAPAPRVIPMDHHFSLENCLGLQNHDFDKWLCSFSDGYLMIHFGRGMETAYELQGAR